VSRPAIPFFRILAAGAFAQSLEARQRRDTREVTRDLGITPIRRANRFINLAVIGAELCRRDMTPSPLPSHAGVYLATAHGSFTDTVTLMWNQLHEQLPVTPFRFVNVLSNVAGFHVAASLDIHGENLAISRLHGAFDAALELASLDLALNEGACALVGGVDEGDESLELHRRRTGTPLRRCPGEGAGWLALEAATERDSADLIHLGDYRDWRDVRRLIRETAADVIAAGPGVWHRPESLAGIAGSMPCRDYHEEFGWSPTNTAVIMAEHHCNGKGWLLHLDRTGPQRQWRLWLVRSSRGMPRPS
jgi:hypothetical protein